MTKSCWVIAGATSAIAKAICHELAKKGQQLVLLGRNIDSLKAQQADLKLRYQIKVETLVFDATQTESHQAIADQCNQLAEGPINLILAFGAMIDRSQLDFETTECNEVISSNFTGAVTLTLAFAPYFKKHRQGRVLVLGSVAGDRGRASNFIYGSAKAGIRAFCQGLRAALHPYKVNVTLMKLGFIDTPMTQGKPGVFLAASPEACAKACLKAAKQGASERYFPWFWCWIMLIIKCIPTRLFNRLKL